ncbi:EF-hand domain-containing protein [Loktanella sp. M215]|uniref:EF-hand domain-containing protein n=1 Tax=Loktanella sp. M215 TaxID=2675431 RepID=UPI001F1A9D1F|nr:EF-hand domain-containing protein [Loktanella sp. M215]MCF7702038.1 calcium-binding protein [Loktanella sp. M215]
MTTYFQTSRKFLLAATASVATLLGGVAIAASHDGQGQSGSMNGGGMAMHDGGKGMVGGMSDMMGMMQRMHGNMMGGGMMDGGQMGGDMMKMFDTNEDGTVTADEMRTELQAKLTEYDADGNGALSIAEFETLHSAMIREMMVDRFQELDADGDGSVTGEEMTAPADKMARMEKMHSGMGGMMGQSDGGMDMKMDMNDDETKTGN